MKSLAYLLSLSMFLAFAPGPARSAEDEAMPSPGVTPSAEESVPAEAVPAPPSEPPAPPVDQQTASPTDSTGQWVYTQQYGWVWAPYGDTYSYVPPDGAGEPYEYVYYPSYGWTWLVAPWVWGIGPWPYFGIFGPSHFGWFHHGWWRTPGRWHFGPRGTFTHRGFGTPGRGFFGRSAAPSRFAGRGFAAGRPFGGAHFGGGGHFSSGARSGGGGHFGGHAGGHR